MNDKDIEVVIDKYKNNMNNIYMSYIEKIKNSTNNINKPITIDNIEDYLKDVRKETEDLYYDLTSELIKNIDEQELIDQKKEYNKLGIYLEVHDKWNKSILSTIGKLHYKRKILIPKDKQSAEKLYNLECIKKIAPLDIALGVDKYLFNITPKLMLEIAKYSIQFNSYRKAENFISELYGFKISNDTIRIITNFIGMLVYKNDCKNARFYEKYSKPPNIYEDGTNEYLLIEMDGSYVRSLTEGESGSHWCEVKLGLLAKSTDFISYINKLGEVEKKIGKRDYVCILGSYHEFKNHLYALYKQNYFTYKNIVIISDGAEWIKSIKEIYFPESQQILDFFHLKENIAAFLNEIYADNSDKSKFILDAWCEKLLLGEYEDLLRTTQKYKDKKLRKGVVNIYNYLLNNKDIIDYPTYISKGYFIGSGGIESSNKTVVQSRLKISGAKWDRKNAQYILSLSAKLYSEKWFIVEDILKNFCK